MSDSKTASRSSKCRQTTPPDRRVTQNPFFFFFFFLGGGGGGGGANRASAEVAINVFAEKYGAKYDKAVECLTKDREALLALYEFPAEHWDHLRTTNPIESVFATVRHRTVRTEGSLSPTTARLMVFKLLCAASKTWRRLKGTNQLPKVIAGVKFGKRHRGHPGVGKPRRLIASSPKIPHSSVCDGGPLCRIMYLETVNSAISNPSFSSSPWMRGAPHKGFSLLIRWMSSRSSRLTGGRPWPSAG